MRLFFLICGILITIALKCDAAQWWYLVNNDNRVVAKQNGPGNAVNLAKDNLIAIESSEDIPLDQAEYRNGKIILHKETTAEKNDRTSKEETAAEEKMVSDKIHKMAFDALKAEGKTFKHLDK